jgi:hypothetical protein
MAEVFAPFPIQRTMCNLTCYMMEGRNFVRTKSSLTRPVSPESSGGLLVHPKGQFYFITSLHKRISPAIAAQLAATVCMRNIFLVPVSYRRILA